jgi:hypothetical protein
VKGDPLEVVLVSIAKGKSEGGRFSREHFARYISRVVPKEDHSVNVGRNVDDPIFPFQHDVFSSALRPRDVVNFAETLAASGAHGYQVLSLRQLDASGGFD